MLSAHQQPPFFEDYEVVKQLDHGGASVVYCVSCRRGRLKGRKLALKKISTPIAESPFSLTSATLHQALHHPNIVALYSIFSISAAQYHALELCPGGNLHDFLSSRDPPVLPEADIRRLLKGMANALLYLQKEKIVHRNINPTNILLTGSSEPKLSDFKLATPIDSPDAVLSEICGLEEYAAPEMRSHSRYGFPVDLWSLGCVVNVSFLGPQTLKSCSTGNRHEELFSWPQNASIELKVLLAGLLEECQKIRFEPSQILSHPFLLTHPPIGRYFAIKESSCPKTLSPQQVQIPALPRRRSLQHLLIEKRPGFAGLDLGKVASKAFISRRVVSDPILSSNAPLVRDHGEHEQAGFEISSLTGDKPKADHLQSSNRKQSTSFAKRLQLNAHVPQQNTLKEASEPNCEIKHIPPLHATGSQPGLPIGTSRPLPFNTSLLNPKTHKSANGQITILPSRSLLIDFRENERRRGMKGDDVLLVHPTGTMIKVYKAPRLSVPCCLVEPTAEYAIHTLPSIYWKQYNDAGRHVEQIKQRTPKLTLHTTNSKCTMMANGPIPDIELLFEPGIPAEFELSDKNPNASSLRIRLSRQHRSLEFAQHVIGDRGPEWTKQLIPCLEVHPFMSESIWVNLEEAKKKAIQQMSHFLRLCETLEAATDDWTARTETVDSLADDGVEKLSDDLKGRDRTRSTSSISSFQILPRPPKLSTGPRRNAWSLQGKVLDEGDGQNFVGTRLSASLDIHRRLDLELTSGGNAVSNDLVPQAGKITGPLEARFLSSVGWCTQYGSLGQLLQGEKYKVLFFDGSILDIDLDKGWVELVDGRGKKIRCSMDAACFEPTLEEPMKHLRHFLTLFETDDDLRASTLQATARLYGWLGPASDV